MIRRCFVVLVLVLASLGLSAEALAQWQIPATAGVPFNSLKVNPPVGLPQYWIWSGDVYVRRPATPITTPETLDWMIPLVFYQPMMTSNAWGAQVIVSQDTTCSLQWRPDASPGAGPEGTTPVTATSPGPLVLTAPELCPIEGPATGCITAYASAYVTCTVLRGGYVGPVTYWIVPP